MDTTPDITDVLKSAPATDEQRDRAWKAFYGAKTWGDLKSGLDASGVPNEVKRTLWTQWAPLAEYHKSSVRIADKPNGAARLDADVAIPSQSVGTSSQVPSIRSSEPPVPQGIARPGYPKPPKPFGLQSDAEQLAEMEKIQGELEREGRAVPRHSMGGGVDLGPTIRGSGEAVQGIREVVTAPSGRGKAAGVHRAFVGAAEAISPVIVPAAVVAPLRTGVGLALVGGTQAGVEEGLTALGLPREYSAVAGDLASALMGWKAIPAAERAVFKAKMQRILQDRYNAWFRQRQAAEKAANAPKQIEPPPEPPPAAEPQENIIDAEFSDIPPAEPPVPMRRPRPVTPEPITPVRVEPPVPMGARVSRPVPTSAPVPMPQQLPPVVPSMPVARPIPPIVDTRGMGVQYHGTSSEIPNLQEYTYNDRNIYGQGFYTTDAVDVAQGYSKKGRGKTPTIYRVSETKPSRLFDMEKPMDSEALNAVKALKSGFIEDILENDKPGSLRELYDEIRAQSQEAGLSTDSVQELFDSIAYNLEQLGYTGLTHIGGKITGKNPHRVNIYFRPSTDISIETYAPTNRTTSGPVVSAEPPTPAVVAPSNTAVASEPPTPEAGVLGQPAQADTAIPLDESLVGQSMEDLRGTPREELEKIINSGDDYAEPEAREAARRLLGESTSAPRPPVADSLPPPPRKEWLPTDGEERRNAIERRVRERLSHKPEAKLRDLAENAPGERIRAIARELLGIADPERGDPAVAQIVESLHGKGFLDVLNRESFGGNAGPGHSGVNGYADKDTGEIVAFGNFQDLPPAIVEDPLYAPVIFRVRNGIAAPPTITDWRGNPPLSDRARAAIQSAVDQYNKEQFDSVSDSLRNKIERIAPELVRTSDKPEWDLMPKVQDAMDLLGEYDPEAWDSIEQFQQQQALFDSREYSPEVVRLAYALMEDTPTQLTKRFKGYNKAELDSRPKDTNQTSMFMDESVPQPQSGPRDAFANTFPERAWHVLDKKGEIVKQFDSGDKALAEAWARNAAKNGGDFRVAVGDKIEGLTEAEPEAPTLFDAEPPTPASASRRAEPPTPLKFMAGSEPPTPQGEPRKGLVSDYESGKPGTEAAQDTGVPRSTAYRWLKEEGATRPAAETRAIQSLDRHSPKTPQEAVDHAEVRVYNKGERGKPPRIYINESAYHVIKGAIKAKYGIKNDWSGLHLNRADCLDLARIIGNTRAKGITNIKGLARVADALVEAFTEGNFTTDAVMVRVGGEGVPKTRTVALHELTHSAIGGMLEGLYTDAELKTGAFQKVAKKLKVSPTTAAEEVVTYSIIGEYSRIGLTEQEANAAVLDIVKRIAETRGKEEARGVFRYAGRSKREQFGGVSDADSSRGTGETGDSLSGGRGTGVRQVTQGDSAEVRPRATDSARVEPPTPQRR